VAVKLNNLRFPLGVVECTLSDFDFMTFPARNVIEDSPSVSNLWILETTVDNNVLVGSVSLEYDVINGKTVPICDTRSFKLERVFSGLDVNNHSLGVHIVVTGSDGGNNGTVPENVAST
jgi:hypothetical protein